MYMANPFPSIYTPMFISCYKPGGRLLAISSFLLSLYKSSISRSLLSCAPISTHTTGCDPRCDMGSVICSGNFGLGDSTC